MRKRNSLTDTELEIMEVFWNCDHGFSFKDLLEYMNTQLGKQWKRQTLTTHLANLGRYGLIDHSGIRSRCVYYACCSKQEYMHDYTTDLVKRDYNNSFGAFACAFTGNETLTDEEIEDLKKQIEEYCKDIKNED